MKNFIISLCVVLGLGAIYLTSAKSEQSIYSDAGSQVLMLVNPDNLNSGGTGFAVQTPSGNVLTMSNAHVCRATKYDYMYVPRGNSHMRLYILAISKDADLCLLTGVPGLSGLPVAASSNLGDLAYVVGHPLLRPTTIERGYLIGRSLIEIYHGDFATQAECEREGMDWRTFDTGWARVTACIATQDAMWTNLRTYPGNSGSPIIDESGAVSGVLFAGDQSGNGYLVPLSEVQRFLRPY